MRAVVRYRLFFLICAVAVYVAGFQWMPQHLQASQDKFLFAAFALGYFALLPFLYWRWVVVAGQQKAWKIVIILSTSCLMARFSFPPAMAVYFEFITWLRYPIVAILVVLQLALMAHVVKQLWSARHLKGDPRVHALQRPAKDDKTREMALMLAFEPASWYYAIPRFSRNHPEVLANLRLWSGRAWCWLLMLIGLAGASVTAYWLLADWSELVALLVSGFILYGVILATANYRVSGRFTLYRLGDTLVVNNTFLNLLCVDQADIQSMETGQWAQADIQEQPCLGRGVANVRVQFATPQRYFTLLGLFSDEVNEVFLVVDNPDALLHLSQRPAEAA